MRLLPRDVEGYFSRYGWVIHPDGDNRWITGWRGDDHSFPMVIEYNETCLSLMVVPLLDVSIDWQDWPEFLQLMGELNGEAKLVKLGLDNEQRLVLSLQVLNLHLSYEVFADAVSIIGYYAETIHELFLNEVFASN